MPLDETTEASILDKIDSEIKANRNRNNDRIKFLLEANAISQLRSITDDDVQHLSNPPLDGAGKPLDKVQKLYGPNEANILAWVATGVAKLLLNQVNSNAAIRGEVTSRLLFEDMDGLGGGDGGMNFITLAIVSGGIGGGDLLGLSGQPTKNLLVDGFTGIFTVA